MLAKKSKDPIYNNFISNQTTISDIPTESKITFLPEKIPTQKNKPIERKREKNKR